MRPGNTATIHFSQRCLGAPNVPSCWDQRGIWISWIFTNAADSMAGNSMGIATGIHSHGYRACCSENYNYGNFWNGCNSVFSLTDSHKSFIRLHYGPHRKYSSWDGITRFY